MIERSLTRLFVQRFIENDLISPDADRVQALSQAGAALITGGLFVSMLLSLPYLQSPYPLPSRTAANMIRVQFLYAAWSSTVMALVALSVWDALSLDSRDTEILGPLPLRRGVIVRAKVSALIMFAAGFAAALNVVPALIHPVMALSRLRPSTLQVATLMAAHITSTTAAAVFGFIAVVGLRESLHALLGPSAFRRVALVVRAGLVAALVTVLLLVPAMSFSVAGQWLLGAIETNLLPPLWFVGLHDLMSGHIWAQLPRPDLPPALEGSERTFALMYEGRRPVLHQVGMAGLGTFLLMVAGSAAAYAWNNRRLPSPPASRSDDRGAIGAGLDVTARRLLARRPLVRAGFFFTMRVLARSVQNRLSIVIPLAVALAVATVSLYFAGVTSQSELSGVPTSLLAIQLLFVTALVIGFRHAVRVPADLRARWMFHLIRPQNHAEYLRGVKRAWAVKLVAPVLIGLLPLHVLTLGWQTAGFHFAFGLLSALALVEAFLMGYRKLPFAGSYAPTENVTAFGGIYVFCLLAGIYTAAWIEHFALGTTRGALVLLGVTGLAWVALRGFDLWRRAPEEGDLDELVEPPTLRLGLME